MALNSLQDLLLDELRDLYSAEQQILKALPEMARASRTPRLQKTLLEHIEDTEAQIQRLENVFDDLNIRGTGRKSRAMMGLLEESADLLDEEGSSAVLDAAIIGAVQRVEHYEIAAYGCAISHADLLGLDHVVELLEVSLREEEEADERLTALAEDEINAMALAAGRWEVGNERSKDSKARRR